MLGTQGLNASTKVKDGQKERCPTTGSGTAAKWKMAVGDENTRKKQKPSEKLSM